MPAAFRGFPPEGLAFLRALARNNNREWFQPRKEIYDRHVKGPMTEFAAALNAVLAKDAPDYVTDPAKAIYRIYRDTRFSHDKTPYKTHVAASFWRRGLAKHISAGFYVGVEPRSVDVAGGVYMPGPEQTLAVRNHLAEHHEKLHAILKARGLKPLMGDLHGQPSPRMPKGFAADHPAGDLLRRRNWVLFVTLEGPLAATPKLFDEVARRFRALVPFVEEINRAFAGSKRGDPLMLR